MSEKNNNLCIVSIRELMGENLSIPMYQRPYRWSTDSVLTLVMDIYEAFLNGILEYRIGSVVLHRINDNKNEVLNIVDGQQRLTTIAIIFYVFQELLGEDDKTKIRLLEEKYNELSYKAIIDNLDIIRRKLKEFDKKQLKEYYNYILENCTIVKIVTDSEQEAFQFFDSQNSRGKELAPHDLLKAYHLREMNDESEDIKVKIINDWENLEQNKLEDLFSNHLYPLVRWYKLKSGIKYSVKDIKVFKGIKKNNNYNFSIYNRAANMFIERFNSDKLYEITIGNLINQFQLTQPIIAGKRFFKYSIHYTKLYNKIIKLISSKYDKELVAISGSGDRYVYNLFINILIFYVDRFNIESLSDTRIFLLYKWTFSLRLKMKSVYIETINNYAMGKSERINKGLNMFSIISEMQDSNELDSISLDSITKEEFEKLNLNKRYNKIYDFIFVEDGKKDD
ncbi:DUF262 domain-containing protein [Parvimonas micra]|uniref:Uncharacterized protein n=1 Tax=Parvimonas micra ATCC 33270 TaxID=411465 RepID=A8SJ35_9FIRM|nr:DUF262 domain-containing protein [Parvimonas micra]EDP24588.1 hypothetical protein PEPMIC_00441 [Parvimonas micra ATCC 33270]RSB91445.1 DUF262 domain-containing protein [Parvimonas micra]VEH95632.1 Uncharacterized conserved protein [Parvimonas micra]